MEQKTEPRVILSITLEMNEEGKIVACAECDCRGRWEYETIIDYLDEVKKKTMLSACKEGNIEP